MAPTRALFIGAFILATFGGAVRAHAQDQTDTDPLAAKLQEAQAAIEAYSYRKAEGILEDALAVATQGSYDKSQVAQVYVMLGVTAIAGSNDLYRGLHHLVAALRNDPKAQVPKELATPQLLQMMKTAKQTLKAVSKPPTIRLARSGKGQKVEIAKPQKGVAGLSHSPIDTAKKDMPIPVKAQSGSDIQAHKMLLFFRPAGTVKFDAVTMKKQGTVFRGAIPAKVTKGRYVHYYIEARDKRGRMAASFGSAKSPTVIIMK